MAYIGPEPAESFTSFATQEFSTSATTSYTLDHAVTNENEIALFINNVRQQPGSGKAYTATGTALTLSAATASTDTMYCVFLGRALQTVTPATNSITAAMISDDAVTGAKLNTDVISAQTALGAEPADTDEFLVSDAGVLKRVDYSYIKGGGKVLQVVQGTDTAQRSTTSSSYVSGTINASITPSASSSKVLVHITGVMRYGTFNIYRDSSDLGGGQGFGQSGYNGDTIGGIHYLDSPNTTSSVTYTGYMKANYGGTAYFGVGGYTVITLMEIGA